MSPTELWQSIHRLLAVDPERSKGIDAQPVILKLGLYWQGAGRERKVWCPSLSLGVSLSLNGSHGAIYSNGH